MTTILGGGIAGLAAAHYVIKRTVRPIFLFEACNRIGGWIRSESHSDESILFESGPRTIRPRGVPGANTLELIEEIGLAPDVLPIPASHVAAQNRMIYAKNQLCLLPRSFVDIFKVLPPFSQSFAEMLVNDWRHGRYERNDDESMYNFIERRFGHEMADYAISPMICGICAGNAKEISVNFLMRELFQKEQKYGGVIKGSLLDILKWKGKKAEAYPVLHMLADQAKKESWSIYSLRGGLETLPRTLQTFIQRRGVEIETSAPCEEIHFGNETTELIVNGKSHKTTHLISALPSYQLAPLVEKQHPTLAKDLREIPFVDVGVVNLQYASPDLLKTPGFGVLVPPIEKLPILGIIFDSCCFNMTSSTVLTVMMGGAWFRQLFGDSPTEETLLETAKQGIERILGIATEPKRHKVNILKKCIPQYVVGHVKRVERIRGYLKDNKLPLHVCGSSYDGVGVNDVILSARKVANARELWN